ncbi:hypothetical protein B0H14DRAFT_3540251 [Mycena olivaceomarginata]|nr:hypothetical protein B0H14DRAFT_3540251 [Mycena olivaceomarginata]
MASPDSEDADFPAARLVAVERALTYIREAAAERERMGNTLVDWEWDRARARDGVTYSFLFILIPANAHTSSAFLEYGRERLPKIRRAKQRLANRRRYISRLPEYARRRGAPEPEKIPWTMETTAANGEWGRGEWGTTDPAWQDPGFWLKDNAGDISPILPIRRLYLL